MGEREREREKEKEKERERRGGESEQGGREAGLPLFLSIPLYLPSSTRSRSSGQRSEMMSRVCGTICVRRSKAAGGAVAARGGGGGGLLVEGVVVVVAAAIVFDDRDNEGDRASPLLRVER